MSRVVVAVVVAVAVALVPSAPRRSPLGIVAYGPGHDYERAAEDEFLDSEESQGVESLFFWQHSSERFRVVCEEKNVRLTHRRL